MIGISLRAVAAFVDDNANTGGDPHQRLSDERCLAKGEKVRAVAHELRVLADVSETRRVRYAEYGSLKDQLYAFGFPLLPKLDQDVATAFREAEGPMQPREKGWLKPS